MAVRHEQITEFDTDLAVLIQPSARDAPVLWPSLGEYGVYDELMYYLMTQDAVRTGLYEEALKDTVRGKVVLDIGTGEDLNWALEAVRAGATRVYALEEREAAFEIATARLAQRPEGQRIQLLNGHSRDIELPEKVDVCVSEIIGTIGSSEGAPAILRDAAERFLRPGGLMIPHTCITHVAGVILPDTLHAEPGFDSTTASYVNDIFHAVGRLFDVRVCVAGLNASHLLTTAGTFESLEFAAAGATEYRHVSTLQVHSGGRLDGLIAWIELQGSARGRTIDSLRDKTSWLPVFFPVWYPGVAVQPGDHITLTVGTTLSPNGVNPDYRLVTQLHRPRHDHLVRRFDSLFSQGGFRESEFYRRLFPARATG